MITKVFLAISGLAAAGLGGATEDIGKKKKQQGLWQLYCKTVKSITRPTRNETESKKYHSWGRKKSLKKAEMCPHVA